MGELLLQRLQLDLSGADVMESFRGPEEELDE
jgi:hypothetical protein